MNKKPPRINSVSAMFKKAVADNAQGIEDDKKEYRDNLRELMQDFMNKVRNGEIQGIRTAKELVEVIKLDLLLAGEVTDRTEENSNTSDTIKIHRIQEILDPDDPKTSSMIESIMMTLNNQNDEEDEE